jgi:hypothetical protein
LYVFEIVNTAEPTVIQILQTIRVPEADFLAGVTVRNILITGLAPDQHGSITYEVSDLWCEGRHRGDATPPDDI